MFELGAVDDLVLPRPGSRTGRALASMSLRRTFESIKRLDPGGYSGDARDAVAELQAAFARRLPGDPHAIAHAIAEPAIGVPLRRALVDPAFVPRAIDRLLVRLGDREGTIAGARMPLFGRIELRSDDALLDACLGGPSSGDVDVGAFRSAIERVRGERPAIHDDLERFASTFVARESGELPAVAIGIGVVPIGAREPAIVRAIVASIVRGKIAALVEGRTYAHAAYEPVVAAAVAVALGEGAQAAHLAGIVVDDADPLRFVLEELRRGG